MSLPDDAAEIVADLMEKSKDPEIRARYKEIEKELNAGKIVELIRRSGIPYLFLMRNFANFSITPENRKAYEACWEYCEHWKHDPRANGSLAVLGNIGVGKTHLSAAVCRKLIDDHLVAARYSNVLHTFEMARMSFQDNRENPIRPLLTAPFLVLDDLGSERPTPWALEQVGHIIDYRFSEALPVMVTSNANSWEGMFKMLTMQVRGDPVSLSELTLPASRIIDRLRDMTGDPLVLGGKSWRGRKAG